MSDDYIKNMNDETLSSPSTTQHGAQRSKHSQSHKAPRKGLRAIIALITIVAVAGATVTALFTAGLLGNNSNDYSGSGSGEVLFTINEGDFGDTIAQNLADAGVTKSFESFYQLLLETVPEPVFTPGVYRLKQGMSAQSALDALLNPENRVEQTVTIPEGTIERDVLQILSQELGIPLAELEQATSDPASYGLPAEAMSFEGFLFPATYTFSPGVTAAEVIKTLVDTCLQTLDSTGVPVEERWDVIRLASVIQRESGPNVEDMYKISRVFVNRLNAGMVMGSDVTTCYGANLVGRDCINITQAALDDTTNLYNTRVLNGLPIGPISNPGSDAISAAFNPADGPWLYFVTINLSTGETVFSETYEQHLEASAIYEQWRKDNPNSY